MFFMVWPMESKKSRSSGLHLLLLSGMERRKINARSVPEKQFRGQLTNSDCKRETETETPRP